MSQVAAKKRLTLKDERAKVTAFFGEQGSVLKGTSEGWVEHFDIEISIESDESAADIVKLIRLAHRMCFTEVALETSVQLRKKHILNGQLIDVETH